MLLGSLQANQEKQREAERRKKEKALAKAEFCTKLLLLSFVGANMEVIPSVSPLRFALLSVVCGFGEVTQVQSSHALIFEGPSVGLGPSGPSVRRLILKVFMRAQARQLGGLARWPQRLQPRLHRPWNTPGGAYSHCAAGEIREAESEFQGPPGRGWATRLCAERKAQGTTVGVWHKKAVKQGHV